MSEPAIKQSTQEFTDLPVGEILRRTRVHYDRSIEDVEAALRIQAKQIHAIEVGDTTALPARVYAIGFVRSYAEYLGLDGEKIVTLFKTQTSEAAPEQDVKKQTPSKIQQKNPPVLIFVALMALVGGSLIGVVSLLTKKDAPPINETQAQAVAITPVVIDEIPEVPDNLKASVLEEQQATRPVEPPKPVKPAVEKQKGIILKMVQNSWVEIRDKNNRKLISRVLKAGDQYFVPDRLDLSISIGNAAGVEILVDGDKLQGLGGKGQVLRRIPLNADVLKKRFPIKAQKPVETQLENE